MQLVGEGQGHGEERTEHFRSPAPIGMELGVGRGDETIHREQAPVPAGHREDVQGDHPAPVHPVPSDQALVVQIEHEGGAGACELGALDGDVLRDV